MQIKSGDLILIKFHYERENKVGVYDETDSFGIWLFNLVGLQNNLTFYILPNAIREIEKIELENLTNYNFSNKQEIIDWFNFNPLESLLTHNSNSIRTFARNSLGLEL